MPDRGAKWPAADKVDSLYLQDALHYLRQAKTAAAPHVRKH